MKRWLMLLLLICIPVCAIADTMTLAELKVASPKSATFMVDGEEVSVPIILPQADRMPILYCDYLAIDAAALHSAYPDYDMNGRLGMNQGYQLLPEAKGETETLWLRDGTAQDCSIPSTRPMEFIQETLRAANVVVDVRIERLLASQGNYHLAAKAVNVNGRSRQVESMDLNRRIEYPGRYFLLLEQYIDEVPVFSRASKPYMMANGQSGLSYGLMDVSAFLSMYSDEIYLLSLGSLFDPIAELEKDAYLTDIDSVINIIQERIDEGMLVSIDSIELGYCPMYAFGESDGQKIPSSRLPEEEYAYQVVLIPCWRVEGYDHKDDQIYNYRYAEEGPDAETRRNATVPFELRIDAQTGGWLYERERSYIAD